MRRPEGEAVTPLDHWLSGQPAAVQVLARAFPFGMALKMANGAQRWVVSWTAERELILSRIEPGARWESARIEDPIWVEAGRVADGDGGRRS